MSPKSTPSVRKPFQSQLVPYLEEIAQLRNTTPHPTSYKRIAEILKEKYKLEISPNSVWSFVRARSIGRRRKLKWVMPDDMIKSQAAIGETPAESTLKTGPPTAQSHKALFDGMKARAKAEEPKKKDNNDEWQKFDPNTL